MSEIQDAAQIIRVSLEGMELTFKAGGAGLGGIKKIVQLFKKLLEHEQLTGQMNVKNLLKTGEDVQVFSFDTKDIAIVKKLAKKYGLLYALLPDLNKADGKSELLFHTQAVDRINAIINHLNAGKVETMEEYLENADEKELEQFLGEDKGKKPKGIDRFDFQAVGMQFARHPGMEVNTVRKVLDMTWEEMRPIRDKMMELGFLEEKEDLVTTFSMEPNAWKEYMMSEKWEPDMQVAENQEIPMEPEAGKTEPILDKENMYEPIQKKEKNQKQQAIMEHMGRTLPIHPDRHNVFMVNKLVVGETGNRIKTRIPYQWGHHIWLNKDQIHFVSKEEKTVFAWLDKTKAYSVVDEQDKVIETLSGEQLYGRYYDPVILEEKQRQAQQRKEHTGDKQRDTKKQKNPNSQKNQGNRQRQQKKKTQPDVSKPAR